MLDTSRRDPLMKPRIPLMVRDLHHGGSKPQLTEVVLGRDRTPLQSRVGTFCIESIRADELSAASIVIPLSIQSI